MRSVVEDMCENGSDLFRRRKVEEFVRAMRIRLWSEYAGHNELRRRERHPEHVQKRDAAAAAISGVAAPKYPTGSRLE